MKRLCTYALAWLAACLMAASCNTVPRSLNETAWTVESYEDLFLGGVEYSEEVTGTVNAYYDAGAMYMSISIPALGWENQTIFQQEDYSVVKYTSEELVLDLLYYEYDDLKRTDCSFIETFEGKMIYQATSSSITSSYNYYVYFKNNGKAVDVGHAALEDGTSYYYDVTRIYCRRLR